MSNKITTDIWILDSNLNRITKILSPWPLDKGGMILRYSKELDEFGQCTFRISAYDPILQQFGDILMPHKYWVQLVRGQQVIWQGPIIQNAKRTKDYIEVNAAEPLWYLDKVLIQRTSLDPSGAGATPTPTSLTMSGTTATITFGQNINQINTNNTQAVPPKVNDTIALSGFTPSGLNGIWQVSAVTANTITVINVTGGPYTVSTMGTVTLSDGIFRTFGGSVGPSGGTTTGLAVTMAQVVTNLLNETIATFQANNAGHALSGLTLGTVNNPNYPPNITNGKTPPADLTGPWYFGDGTTAPKLSFDYHSVLYVLKSLGIYSYADFYIDNNLTFNFVPFKGNNLTQKVNFNWGGPNNTPANIINYNLPRFGQRMYNDLYGVATDNNGVMLHFDGTDQNSISTYGLIQGVASYTDVHDQATLNARIQAEIPLINAPDSTAISITLNEKGYPIGYYDVGDVVTVNIQNKAVSFNDTRRIVGISIQLHNTGREFTTVQTNKVLPFQIAALGSPQ